MRVPIYTRTRMTELKSSMLTPDTEGNTANAVKPSRPMNLKVRNFRAAAVKGYSEGITDSFEEAISKAKKYIDECERNLELARKRIAILTEAQKDVFATPREFERHQTSLRYVQMIETRRSKKTESTPVIPPPPQPSEVGVKSSPATEKHEIDINETLDKINSVWGNYFDNREMYGNRPMFSIYWPGPNQRIEYARKDVATFNSDAHSFSTQGYEVTDKTLHFVYSHMTKTLNRSHQ